MKSKYKPRYAVKILDKQISQFKTFHTKKEMKAYIDKFMKENREEDLFAYRVLKVYASGFMTYKSLKKYTRKGEE